MLIADAASGRISHVSDNTQRVIDADPTALLGRSLGEVLDPDAMAGIADVLDPARAAGNPVAAFIDGRRFDAIAHALGDRIVVELEVFEETPALMTRGTRDAMRRLVRSRSVTELWETTARELRSITGFDRVMVYHFHPDFHGEVVAEAVAHDMEPYLGLHYPASDIPAQARALYVTKLSRQIADSHREPAGLLADANQPDAGGLDLSETELRAVSPHHREFMRNMGQTSTFSLSLVLNDALVGMITCAHRTPKVLPYNIRDGLEILANQVSLQLATMREIERLAQRNEVRELRSAIVSQLARSEDVAHALLHQHITMLDLIPADGAVVRLGDKLSTLGATPSASALALLGSGLPEDLVTDSLGAARPDLAEAMPGVAGVLVRRLGSAGDFIAWFRGERAQTVNWLGDMSLANRVTPLSPRSSFSAWSEEVEGTSEPWDGLEREARELGNDLQATLLQRAQSQLADLALRDPLTSLPNRRLFMERLDEGLRRAGSVAVLFVDVDRFKQINDRFGHAAGDEALVRIARALTNGARATDLVARLGGDEFVVLCEDITRGDAELLADRLEQALAADASASPDGPLAASIGVAFVDGDHDMGASQLLSAADEAMYRVKQIRVSQGR